MDVNKNEGQERSMGILDKTKIYTFSSKEDKLTAIGSDKKTLMAIDCKYIYWHKPHNCWFGTNEKEAYPEKEIIHWNKPMYDHKNIYLFSCAKDCAEFAKEMAKTEKVCLQAQKEGQSKFIGLAWSDCFNEWISISEFNNIHLRDCIIVNMTGQKPTPCPITDFEPLNPSICYEFKNEKHAIAFCQIYNDRANFHENCFSNHGYKNDEKMYLIFENNKWRQNLDVFSEEIQPIHGLEWPNSTSQSQGEEMNTTGFTRKVRQAAENLVTATESSRPMEPMQNFGMRLTWAALWPVRILLRTVGVSALNGARTVFNAATFGGLCYGAYWLYNNVHIQF